MDFNWYLNRQGVRGAKGVKGDKGDSPIIEVAVENANEYKLKVVNPDGTTITSPNLRGNKIDTSINGTYVRYNPVTGNLYTDEIDSATTETEGIVRLADSNDMITRDELSVVTPSALSDNLIDFLGVSSDGLLRIYQNTNGEVIIDSGLIYNKFLNIESNITTNSSDIYNNTRDIATLQGVLNSLPATYVNFDDDQTIAGLKTFLRGVKADKVLGVDNTWSIQAIDSSLTIDTGTSRTLRVVTPSVILDALNVDVQANTLRLKAAPVITGTDGNDYYFLSQDKVKAGDNITITQNASGITISSTGGEGSAPSNMVTTDTSQAITATKTFNAIQYFQDGVTIGNTGYLKINNNYAPELGSDSRLFVTAPVLTINGTNTLRLYNPNPIETNSGFVVESGKLKSVNDNLTITTDSVTGEVILNVKTQSGGGSAATNNGLEGDYHSKYGIIDYTGSRDILTYAGNDLTVNAPLVLNCAGNGEAQKTTIASAMTATLVTTEGLCIVFYAGGELLECGKVDYSEEEPEDNGIDTYQAWFNPNKTTNPNQQWQFKSNNTGNVWRTVEGATPIADVNVTSGSITSAYCFKYRHIDKKRIGDVTTDVGVTFKGTGYRFNDGLNIGTSSGKLSASGATMRMTVGSTGQYYNFSNAGITLYGNSYFALGTSYGSYNAIYIRTDSAGKATITNSDQTVTWLRSSDIDNQTIQIVDGKLHCNLDELGNEVNTLATRVTQLEEQLGVLIQKLDEINGEEI